MLEYADGSVPRAVLVDLDAYGGGWAEYFGQALCLLNLLERPRRGLDLVVVLGARWSGGGT